jgi:hypothetical protein
MRKQRTLKLKLMKHAKINGTKVKKEFFEGLKLKFSKSYRVE